MRILSAVAFILAVLAPLARGQTPAGLTDGFEEAKLGAEAPEWLVPTPGWEARVTADGAAEGKQFVRLSRVGPSDAPFGNLLRTLDAAKHRGQRVVLSAKLRVEPKLASARAQMWLRVDRPGGRTGGFDNMQDRPIVADKWKDAVIEVDVDADAKSLAFGFMAIGEATVYIDDVSIRAAGNAAPVQAPSPPAPLSNRSLLNLGAASRLLAYVRFFCASDQCAGVQAWDHFAVDLVDKVESANDPVELARRLAEVFTPLAPELQVWAGSLSRAPAVPAASGKPQGAASWRHEGVGAISTDQQDNVYSSRIVRKPHQGGTASETRTERFVLKLLGGGVSCRLPFEVGYDEEGTLPHGKTPERWATAAGQPRLSALNRSTRLAGIATAWGVFQHFYPYFDVVDADWDEALAVALKKTALDPDEGAYLQTLRELLSKLHDGHGGVYNRSLAPSSFLPLLVEWAGDDLAVAGKAEDVPEAIKIGDVVVAIDGKLIGTCIEEASRQVSAATAGWRRQAILQHLLTDYKTDDPVKLTLRHPGGSEYAVSLGRGQKPSAKSVQRPENGTELAPGIIYFDLSRRGSSLAKAADQLAAASGIVFDLRGYPDQAAYEVLQHLIKEPATSAQWLVPVVTRPDREGWEWNDAGRWDIRPLSPRWKAVVAFVTDARAISYAESILGIVEHYKLGDIVGAATAGTNGNVNPFALPGDYRIIWTGMKVLKHDGSRHHGLGIQPTVSIEPTVRGIAAGRDEVLEKAVEVVKAKVARE